MIQILLNIVYSFFYTFLRNEADNELKKIDVG